MEETSSFPLCLFVQVYYSWRRRTISRIKKAFEDKDASFSVKPSRTGKYDSVSINLTVSSAQEVIDMYQKVENIEGIISL